MKLRSKRIVAAVLLAANVSVLPLPEVVSSFNTIVAEAHSGRTDSSGGHHDYKNKSGLGSYHYHHGYSAHLHPNGICPYSPQSSNQGSSQSSAPTASAEPEIDYSFVFDADYYAQHNSDVAAACGNDAAALLNHFINNGMAEGRRGCESFDVNVYKENNSDLSAAYGNDLKSYYLHYINCGHSENRTCHR